MKNVTEDVMKLLSHDRQMDEWYKFFNISRYHFVRITSGGNLDESELKLYHEILLQAIQCGGDFERDIRDLVAHLKNCFLEVDK